jgi:Rod binding domain-containing protein
MALPSLQISPWDLSAQQAQANRLRRSGDTRAQLEEAARGFENVMIRKWIETARRASIDQRQGPIAAYDNLVDDQLAFLISRQGGVGFVQPMVQQMLNQIKARVLSPGESALTLQSTNKSEVSATHQAPQVESGSSRIT